MSLVWHRVTLTSLSRHSTCYVQIKEVQDAATRAREGDAQRWQREKADWDARIARITTEAAASRQAAELKATEERKAEAARTDQRVCNTVCSTATGLQHLSSCPSHHQRHQSLNILPDTHPHTRFPPIPGTPTPQLKEAQEAAAKAREADTARWHREKQEWDARVANIAAEAAASKQAADQATARLEALDREKRVVEEANRARAAAEEARLKALGMSTSKLNVGFMGPAGSGKSTLVNSLRGLMASDAGAAVARAGRETTMVSAAYPHPAAPFVVLWDLPGGDTKSHPAETYFEDRCLHRFDCLVVLYPGRFTGVCGHIVKKAFEQHKTVLIVCSRTDDAVGAVLSAHHGLRRVFCHRVTVGHKL